MGNTQNLSYPAQLLRDHDRQRFLHSLFVPLPAREAVCAVLALDVEMRHVHQHVSEEMLGHIRYAWWEESLAMIGEGKKPREHPVLLALEQVIQQGIVPAALLMQIVAQYRTHYPALPPEHSLVDELALMIIRARAPEAEKTWNKAAGIIQKHRKRYGRDNNGWLSVKLLMLA